MGEAGGRMHKAALQQEPHGDGAACNGLRGLGRVGIHAASTC